MTLRSIRVAAAVVCAAFVPAFAQDLPKAETLMDKYIEATGGKAAHEKIKNYVMTGNFEMASQGLSAKMTIWRMEGKSYAQIEIPNLGLLEEGYDGSVAWSKNPMQGARIKEGAEKEVAAFGASLNPDLRWRELFSDASTVGAESVNGVACYKVSLTTKGGLKMDRWFDQKTGLIVKTQMTLSTPQGEMPMEGFLSEYKPVDGVQTPHKLIQVVMGQEMAMTFQSIKANQEIDPAKFALPDDIKALVKK